MNEAEELAKKLLNYPISSKPWGGNLKVFTQLLTEFQSNSRLAGRIEQAKFDANVCLVRGSLHSNPDFQSIAFGCKEVIEDFIKQLEKAP